MACRIFFIVRLFCHFRHSHISAGVYIFPIFVPQNKKTDMNRKKAVYLSCAVAMLLIICAVVPLCLLMNRPVTTMQAGILYIDEDDTADSVCCKLEKQFQARRMAGFRLLVSMRDYGKHVHTGAYSIFPEETTLQLFRKLNYGHQIPVKLVVPATRTVGQMVCAVSRQIMVDSIRLASLLDDSIYCASLGFNKETLPALFLPNTYEVYWNMSVEEFVRRMKKEYDRFWNGQRRDKAKAVGLTPLEVSTLASIVEGETSNTGEMPVVAGLYLNRLRIGMPLQADPTVKFALKDFGLKRILFKHLETDSPYNTYKNTGLPPGPISIPSLAAIESVLNPSHHDYLYMCAKEDLSGTHNFARTLSQHQVNARRYQQALNQMRIR